MVRRVRGFAAKLTDYGRGKGLKIHEIPYSEAQRIYEEQAKDKLPLTEAEFREVISAEYMVFGRKGSGGPQIVEVKRALSQAHKKIQSSNLEKLRLNQSIKDASAYLIDQFNFINDKSN